MTETDTITFLTSAPADYDGASTRTLAVVGHDTRRRQPVRQVECQHRDHEWQTGRYASGLYPYTSDRLTAEMLIRFGDWTLTADAQTG